MRGLNSFELLYSSSHLCGWIQTYRARLALASLNTGMLGLLFTNEWSIIDRAYTVCVGV